MMLTYQLPDSVQSGGADLIRVASYVTAILVIVSALMHPKSPLRKVCAWLWRRNVSQPVSSWAAHTINAVAKPLIEETSAVTRAASLAQHDEQNSAISAGFTAVNGRLDVVSSRLDLGGRRMDGMTERIDKLETKEEAEARTVGIVEAVIDVAADPPPRTKRTRQGDPE